MQFVACLTQERDGEDEGDEKCGASPPGLRAACAAAAFAVGLGGGRVGRSGGRPGEEAEHPVHHGRRHRLDAAEHLPPRPDGRRNAQHRPHRPRGRDVHGLRRHAELHLRAQRLLHRHVSAAHRHDPAAAARAARPTCGPAPRRSPSSCSISATPPASSARTTWATTPRRCRRRTASRSTGATSTTWTRCSR